MREPRLYGKHSTRIRTLAIALRAGALGKQALDNEASDRGPSKGLLGENTAHKRDLLHVFRRSVSLQPLRDWRAVRTIARSGLFDREWYLKSYPDVVARGIDPVRHYVAYGASERRDPSPSFSTRGYLSRNRDVVVAEVNPFEHFVRHGKESASIVEACSF